MSDFFDDLDFLSEIGPSIKNGDVEVNKVGLSLNKKDIFSIDVDNNDTSVSNGVDIPLKENVPSQQSDDEFMNWLSDIETAPSKSVATSNNITGDDSTTPVLINSVKVNTAGKDVESMDNFFDEVFGKNDDTIQKSQQSQQPSYPNSDTKISITQPNAVIKSEGNTLPNSTATTSIDTVDFEKEIEMISRSSFPDVGKLRDIVIHHLGYIPDSFRGQIWNLLLTGQSQEDLEITSYNTSNSTESLSLAAQIGKDCDSLISNYIFAPHLDVFEARQNLSKILILYCTRKQVEYNRLCVHLLLPMLFSDYSIPPSIASCCLYNLASDFAPFLNLKPAESDDGLYVVHTWLRLLVNYHSPMLVQHLDKILPGWEQPSSNINVNNSTEASNPVTSNSKTSQGFTTSSTVLEPKINNDNNNNNNDGTANNENSLDELERELGLSIGDTTPSLVRNESESSMKMRETGCVPIQFVCGLFTSSLPPQQACVILDWAILNNEKYAGVYYTAALLEIFSSNLLAMNGSEIRCWLQDVAIGKSDWYKSKNISIMNSVSNNSSSVSSELTWEKFVNGWIYAAASLQLSTPKSFQRALNATDKWNNYHVRNKHISTVSKTLSTAYNSANKKQQIRNDNSNRYNNSTETKINIQSSTDNNTINDNNNNDDTTVDYYEEYDDGRQSHGKPSVLPSPRNNHRNDQSSNQQPNKASSSESSIFFDRFLNMAPMDIPSSSSTTVNSNFSIPTNNISTSQQQPSTQHDFIKKYQLKWQHESKSTDNTMCLWSDAEEVIPCLCSNRRRPTTSENVLTYFQLGINVSSESLLSSSYQSSSSSSSGSSNSIPSKRQGTNTSSAVKRGNKGVSFPLDVDHYPDLKPFYFGIDCRSEKERSLGHFPKAYIVDSVFTSDSDEISALLETLKPLASSVHLCIIGSGYEYFAYQHQRNTNTTPQQQQVALNNSLRDYESKLNSIIIFFQKKSFRHVSYLDGGFMEATKYLRRPDTTMELNTALVDADVKYIDSILGIGSSKNKSNELNLTLSSGINSSVAGASFSSQVVPVVEKTKQLLGGIGQTFANLSIWNNPNNISSRTESLNASATAMSPTQNNSNGKNSSDNQQSSHVERNRSARKFESSNNTAFVIDDDDEEVEDSDAANQGKSLSDKDADSNTISISRTDQQRQQALAMHKLAGLKRGDVIVLNKDNLPGAVLFPALACTEEKNNNTTTVTSDHRFLAITRERFIALDSNGKGVGHNAIVVSNNHLTELQKITFRKRDPEFITLFFLTAGVQPVTTDDTTTSSDPNIQLQPPPSKTQQYRISKRLEFIEALQKNMIRFK